MILTGALAGERTATPRRKNGAAKSIVDALKLIPGVEVTPLRLPLDFSPTGNFKGGDDEDAVTVETEAVVLRVVRKVGT